MPAVKTVTKKTAKTAGKPVRKTAKKVTIDDVWAIIAEIGKAHEGFRKEHEKTLRELKEEHKETEKTLRDAIRSTENTLNKAIDDIGMSHKETEKTLNKAIDDLGMSHKETEKTLNKAIDDLGMSHRETEKTLNKAIGGLSNTMGALVEKFMTAGLPQKFKQLGFTFNRVTTVKWASGENNIYTQIDGLLENGNQAMAVEVKTTLRNEDVDDHLLRMEKVRRYAAIHGDRREFLGAIAAAIVDNSAREYALKKGFFVIEPSGEDVIITKPVSEKVWKP